MLPGIYAPAMAYDQIDDAIILFGGEDSNLNILDETWRWDGSNLTQLFPTDNPGKRQNHRMVYDCHSQRILLFGGHSGSRIPCEGLWAWDGLNWEEVQVTGISPASRWGHSMTYDNVNGRVYLFGGYSGSTGTWFSDLWYFENNTSEAT